MSREKIHASGKPSNTPNAAFGWLRQSPAQSTMKKATPISQLNIVLVPLRALDR